MSVREVITLATWTLDVTASGTAHDMNVDSTQKIKFAGAAFADTIQVGSFQQSMHIMNADDSDECDNHPTNKVENLSYLTDTTAYHRGTTGSGEIALNTLVVPDKSCLRYTFAHGVTVQTSGGVFYAYDGSVQANPANGVAAFAVEPPDTSWTAISGSAQSLSLTDQATNTGHYFYVGVSAGPESVGSKTGWKLRLEITYY